MLCQGGEICLDVWLCPLVCADPEGTSALLMLQGSPWPFPTGSMDRAILQRSPGNVSAAQELGATPSLRIQIQGWVSYESNVHPAACMPAAVIPGHRSQTCSSLPGWRSRGQCWGNVGKDTRANTPPASDPQARQAWAPGSTRGGDGCQGAAASPRKWMEIAGTRRPQLPARPLAGSRGRCQCGDSSAGGSDILLPLKASHLRVLKCWTPAF